MLSQRLKVGPGARPGNEDSTPPAGPPRMRALALGGQVGIESQPRNKYSLGTGAGAFSELLPHSWPCGSSRTLSSTAAATEDLMTASWGPRASCQPAQPWPGPQACFNLQIIKPQLWTTTFLLSVGETEAMPQGISSQGFPRIWKEQGSDAGACLSQEGCTPF